MTAPITERSRAELDATCEPSGADGAHPAPRRPAARWAWLLTYGGYAVLQVLQLFVLHRMAPRFFWYDDSQAQFGPMAWWMGTHMQGGRPPLMDADQGMAGNLTADMQYGALDPLHWALQALAGRADDLLFMSWAFAALCVLGLGGGVLVLLRTHGVRPLLAVTAAVGTGSSGFFLWYGGAWWPLMWSIAWLPWFWWGLSSRRWWAPAVLGLASWGLLASGNPYVLFFLVVLVLAQVWERFRDSGRDLRALLHIADLARVVGMVAGFLMALPTLATTVQSSALVSRQAADPVVGNIGFGVSNLADVLLGSPTLMGQTNAWAGNLGLVPGMYTLLFAVPAVALVDWRRAIRSRGVLTAAALFGVAVVFTQLPTTVSVFRYPVRYLVVVQVALPVLVVLALSAAPLLTRRRVTAALGIVAVQAVLAEFRAPFFPAWHLLAAVLTALAIAALVVRLGMPVRRRGAIALAGVLLVVLPWSTALLGERMMVSLQDRMDVLNATPASVADADDEPYRALYPGVQLGTTVEDYRAHSIDPGGSATVLTFDNGADSGWSSGVLRGNGNLIADFATGTGSFAVWQERLNAHWCRSYQGSTCGDPQWLLDQAPGTGKAWVDVLADDTVYVSSTVPEPLRQHFDQDWARVGQRGEYTEYSRDDQLPGRVTVTDGVTVEPGGATSGLAYGDQPMDTYTVSTGSQPGTLTSRITYWPGLTATLDGVPLPVGTVDDAVLSLTIPAGTDAGELKISFQPIGEKILVPCLALGALMVLAAGALGLIGGRRGGRPGARRASGRTARATTRSAATSPATPTGAASTALADAGPGRPRVGGLRQLLHFLLGSCLGVTVDLSVFAIAVWLGASAGLANTLSAGCAVVVVYLFVTKYAFQSGRSRTSFALFVAWYVLSIVVFSLLIELLHTQTGWAPFVCKLVSLPPSFAANFLASKLLFGRNPVPRRPSSGQLDAGAAAPRTRDASA